MIETSIIKNALANAVSLLGRFVLERKVLKMNKEHECIIGVYHEYEETDSITFNKLVDINMREQGWYEKGYILSKPLPLQEYFDKRIPTNLGRFDYCPKCGKKIDWSQLKKEANKYGN